MDQGSYSRPDGRGHPTISSQSAGNSNYKVNVNRQKTKKWVEAKSQNYDGDDWGAEEYEEEDDDEPAVPPVPSTSSLPPQHGARPPSGGNVPSLHLQTQQPPQPQGHAPPANVASSGNKDPATVAEAVASSQSGAVPQSASSTYPLSPRSPPDSLPSTTPQTTHPPAGNAPAFVRPSDIYRRMEEEREKARLSSESGRPSLDQLTNQRSASPSKLNIEQTTPSSIQQAPRSEDYSRPGQDPTATGAQVPSTATNQATTPTRSKGGAFDGAGPELDQNRASASPKLPDVARMSAFGPDLFSTGGFMPPSSPQKENTEAIQEQQEPPEEDVKNAGMSDKSETTAEPSTAEAAAGSQKPATGSKAESSVSAQAASAPAGTKSEVTKQDDANSSEKATAPSLKTESVPAAARTNVDASRSDVTPTEPLNLHRQDVDVPNFEPPSVQRQPTYGTDTSSPLKESDVLRDEIMKSLGTSTAGDSDPKLGDLERQNTDQSTRNRARDSSYTLKDYDSYWADSGDAPDVPETDVSAAPNKAQPMATVHEEAPRPVPEVAITGVSHSSSAASAQPDQAASPPSKSPAPQREVPVLETKPVVAEPAIDSQSVREAPPTENKRRRFSWEMDEEADQPEQTVPPVTTEPPTEPSDVPAITTSQFTPPQRQESLPATTSKKDDVPSSVQPADQTSDKSKEEERMSLVDENNFGNSPLSRISTPPDEHPALSQPLSPPAVVPAPAIPTSSSSPKLPGPPTMAFKEIMDMNSSTERIAKFKDTRVSFAVMDTGLDRWLASMQSEHPEHLGKGLTSPGATNNGDISATSTGQPSQQQPTQQPYYQQYLNASAPSPTSTPSGRPRLGGLGMTSSGASSGFGHSSNQIGTKGKEFMHSAGKMGKGLLSKGKNKFRGSGDKGESPTSLSPVQAKTKTERRSSWALSLGGKLRTDIAPKDQPSSYPQPNTASRTNLTPAPQIPEPEPVSPFDTDAATDKSAPWAQPVVPAQHVENAPGYIGRSSAAAPSHTQQAAAAHQLHEQSRLAPALKKPEDSGVAFNQNAPTPDSPKRHSSFVGLPPIRRTSTFAITSKVKRATERFPLDDDDEVEPKSSLRDDIIGEHVVPEEHGQQVNDETTPRAPHQEQFHQQAAPSSEIPAPYLKKDEPSVTQHEVGSQSSEHLPAQHNDPPVSQPVLVNPSLATSGPWKLEESHLSEPLHPVTRNRPSPSSSPQMYHGFDKETGGRMNEVMPPPQQPPFHSRQRSSDIPPSSAQRYPGLFAPSPGMGEEQQWNSDHYAQSYRDDIVNPRRSNEYFIPGVGPPEDDRGRPRRSSGFFKEIGGRISRTTSRERRSSATDQRPAAPEFRGDEASDLSFPADEAKGQKKRHSFIPAFMTRPSIDSGRQSFSGIQRSHTDMNLASDAEERKERKRSFFGAGLSGLRSQRDAEGNRSMSSFGNDAAPNQEYDEETTPKKKRLSGIAKVFQRNKEDRSPERPSSQDNIARPRSSGFLSNLQLGPKRDSNTGAFDMAPPPVPGDDSKRGSRRNSISEMLSSFKGKSSGSRPSSQGAQQPPRPQEHLQQPSPVQFRGGVPPPPLQIRQDAMEYPGNARTLTTEHRAPLEQDQASPLPTHSQHVGPSPLARETSETTGEATQEPVSRVESLDSPEPPFAETRSHEDVQRPGTSSTITPKEGGDRTVEQAESRAASSIALAGGSDSEIWKPALATASPTPKEANDGDTERERSSVDAAVDAVVSGEDSDFVSARPSVSSQVTESDMSRQITNDSLSAPSDPSPAAEQLPAQRMHTGPGAGPGAAGFAASQIGRPSGAPSAPAMAGAGFRPPGSQAAPPPAMDQWHYVQGNQRMQNQPAAPAGFGRPTPNMAGYNQPIRVATGSPAAMPPRQPPVANQVQSGYYGQPASASDQATAQGSRWKDLRNRMSGQMAGLVQNQSKGEKAERVADKNDKATGGKLRGAFKRMSKQHGSTDIQQQHPAGMQPIAPGPQPPQNGHVYPHRMPQPLQQQQGPMMNPVFNQSVPTAQQYQPQGFAEPQYAAVPIPQGYTAVYGEGSQVPASYNVGRYMSPEQTVHGRQQPQAYGNYRHQQYPSSAPPPQPQVPHGIRVPQMQHPAPAQPQQQRSPPPSEQFVSPTSDRSGQAVFGRTEPSPPMSKQASSLYPQDSHNSLEGQVHGNRASQVSHDSRLQPNAPRESDVERAGHSTGSDTSPERRVSANSPPVPNVVMSSHMSDSAGSDKVSSPPAAATHLTADSTGGSKGAVSDMSRSSSANKAEEHTVELEDTEEARKRTMRIASQEEKIAFDPNENEPQMSATSYPGQEWNPYGEPGFGDWRED